MKLIILKPTMRLSLIIFGLLISSSIYAQRVVKGVVYDRGGPIQGVVVTEKFDSLNKVVTNHLGEFEIIANNQNPVLAFTFVGLMTKTVQIKNSDPLKVKMKFDNRRYKDIEKN